jgi:hypothetical protein
MNYKYVSSLPILIFILMTPAAHAFTGDLTCSDSAGNAGMTIFVPANADSSITLSNQTLTGASVQIKPIETLALSFGSAGLPNQFPYNRDQIGQFNGRNMVLSANQKLTYGIYTVNSGEVSLVRGPLNLQLKVLKQVTLQSSSPAVQNAAEVTVSDSTGRTKNYSCVFTYPWE